MEFKKNIKKITLILIFTLFSLNISFSQNYTLGNSDVSIEWQSLDSYTPTFYKGRALPGQGSLMKAIAIVSLNGINTDDLYYDWSYDDFHLQKYSNVGSKIVYFTLDELKKKDVLTLNVYIDSNKTTLLGKASIEIRPWISTPLLYKKNQSSIITYSNILNKKYEDLKVEPEDSFTIIAEPYFFSTKNTLDSSLNYSWKRDNISSIDNNSNIFKYFAGDVNTLNLKISHNQKTLQEGEALINFSINK